MLVHWLFVSLFVLMWGGWLAVWNVMARRAKVVAQQESAVSRLTHVVPLLIAAYLLVAHVPLPFLNERFVPPALWSATVGAALTFAGLAFAIWARFVIAGNWSSYVELKQDHELIIAGPYRLGPPSDLYRPSSGLRGLGPGGRRVARRACRRNRRRLVLAQAQARGDRHARSVRRGLRPIRRARAGARAVCVVIDGSLSASPSPRPPP